MITHEEELVGGVAIINRVENSIVAHKSLEIEPVLRVALNPTVPRISGTPRFIYKWPSLNSVATPAGASRDRTVGIDLGIPG